MIHAAILKTHMKYGPSFVAFLKLSIWEILLISNWIFLFVVLRFLSLCLTLGVALYKQTFSFTSWVALYKRDFSFTLGVVFYKCDSKNILSKIMYRKLIKVLQGSTNEELEDDHDPNQCEMFENGKNVFTLVSQHI